MPHTGDSVLIYAAQRGDTSLCCQACNMTGRGIVSGGGTYSDNTISQDLRLFRLSTTELILKVGIYGGADIFYTKDVTFTNLGSSYDETGLYEFDKQYLILKT